MREIKFRVWDKLIHKMITENNVREMLDNVNGDYNTYAVYDGDEWYPAYEILGVFDYFEYIAQEGMERYNENSEKRFEIMQYTGLKDKNGKEIYEGDIVKITDKKIKNNKVVRMQHLIAEIVWSEEYLAYILITTSIKDAFENLGDYLDDYDIQVIGNIYENPELLEVHNG